jgi:flagellin
MSLRINHNTNSLNAHRNLKKANERVSKSLERLSSGMRINSAGDGAAELVASEQLRAQVASIDQAIKNSESSITMVQTAEGALAEANNTLVAMRQLALQSANEGSNDDAMLAANQTSIKSMIQSIDRVAEFTQFGQKKLLDGSNGVSGLAIGEGLMYVEAAKETKSSCPEGYDVMVTQYATKASLTGETPLTKEMIDAGERLSVTEGGKSATYVTQQSDTVEAAVINFAAAAKAAGLDVTITQAENGAIMIEHNQYGSEHSFTASSTTAGVISTEGNTFRRSNKGVDLQGTINGEATIGKGITMTGISGNANTDGLTVSYRPKHEVQIMTQKALDCLQEEGVEPDEAIEIVEVPDEGLYVGKVKVTQNALTFQIGSSRGQTVDIAMQNTAANSLAKGVDNSSGFNSLADINVTTAEKATDSLALIDAAMTQITKVRADLGAFQNNTLAINVANMQIAKENMVAAESNIRDTDMAAEMAEFTRHNMIMQSSAAMLAQANQIPKKVLRLLD